ncbi:MAG: hypothetical protein HKN76_22545 [Saprospiraceae bacterium]|nr:hypothetical protein [Saprospiraceae bacterium]
MKTSTLSILAIISLTLMSWNNSLSDLTWESKLKDQNLEVFKSTGSGSKTAYKFIAQLNAGEEEVLEYLFDIDMIREKFPMCKSLEILEKRSDHDYIFYIILDFPMPLRDRDIVISVKQRKNKDGSYHITTLGLPDYLPAKSKLVRIPTLESNTFLKMNKANILLTQISTCDLGGSIPDFLVNMVIPRKISQSFYKMKSKLEV